MLIKRLLSKNRHKNSVSIRDFYNKRNKIVIIRNARGLGDILMHRMIFEDFKKNMPDSHITFACPNLYHDAIKDHPFIDAVIDSNNIDKNNYAVSYDTSTCCIKWECANAPNAGMNRADLWAKHCGIELKNHNMHVPFIDDNMLQFGRFQVKQARSMCSVKCDLKAPNVLLSPIAFDIIRTLTDEQIIGTVNYLRKKGCFVYSTHNTKIDLLEHLKVPVLAGFNTHQWMSFIHAADYVVTVDTATFHYAGGIKKPMTAIFTHVDGKFRGKYYEFVLVQKHRDDGNWPCGPCYNHLKCTHKDCVTPNALNIAKPCLTHITVADIQNGIDKMLERWPK